MKRHIHEALAVVGFLIVLTLVILRISYISLPVFDNSQGTQTGFLDEKNNTVDVIFLGTSNMFHSINPVVMYSETGITSYDWGSSSQSLNMSYMYLKEALKTQSPKVVCLEVMQVCGNSSKRLYEPGMRWGFTYFPLSTDKLEALNVQLDNKNDFEYLSYILPVLRYKSRWKELTRDDFENKSDTYLKGCKVSFITQPQSYPDDYYADVDVEIKSANIVAFNQIVELCKDEGIELVLFKGPNTAIWKDAYSKKVERYANTLGLKYIDYNHMVDELGIDLDADFQDESHTNVFGQTKVTKHMGQFLKENYDLKDHREDEGGNSYDKAVITLASAFAEYYLGETDNLNSFLSVMEGNPYVVICQINGNVDESVAGEVRTRLGMNDDSVACVVDIEKNEKYFETSQMGYEWHRTIDGHDFSIESSTALNDYYMDDDGIEVPVFSSSYDGKTMSQTDYGVSIMIYDKLLGRLVSFSEFDGSSDARIS